MAGCAFLWPGFFVGKHTVPERQNAAKLVIPRVTYKLGFATLNRKMKRIPWLVFLFMFTFPATAQQKQGANWIFGEALPIDRVDFNGQKPTVTPLTIGVTNWVAKATISDAFGNLLFFNVGGYICSRQIVNGIFQQMPNGNLMLSLGNKPPASSLIIQSPANPQIYYLFMTCGGSAPSKMDLYAVQVDMRLNNGFGDVVPNSLTLLDTNASFKLAALLHNNNRDTWIMTQNFAGDTLVNRLLTPNGIQSAVKTPAGRVLAGVGRLKSSPNSEMFATSSSQGLEVYDFNRTTGIPSHRYTLSNPNPLLGNFASAFSPDNSKIYAGFSGGTGGVNGQYFSLIDQFDLAAGNAQQVQQSRYTLLNATSGKYLIYDMQLGIDGKLYYLDGDRVNRVAYLNQIRCPNLASAASSARLFVLPLNIQPASSTLPSLNQTHFRNANKLQAQALRDSICAGDSVQLSAFGAGAEHFKWQPANGLTAPFDTLANPFVKPTATTTYMITGSSLCRSDTAYVKVTVVQNPTGISISGPVSVCPQLQNVVYKAHNPQNHKLTWGINGGTITNTSPDSISVNWGNANATAKVWLLAQNVLVCPGDTVFLPVSVNVILATETPKGPDTLCLAAAKNIPYQISKTTGSVYSWGISGGTIISGQGTNGIKVNWLQSGNGKLWAQEESHTASSHCFGNSDTLRVLVQPSPVNKPGIKGPVQVFTFAENQEYSVQNPAAGSSFTWEVTNGQLLKGQGSSSISVNWENAGTGTVGVTEKNLHSCEGSKSTLTVQISGAPQPLFYNIITPNADGKNDSFEIGNLKWYPENELQIYNRWGMEVYRTKDYRNTWQGGNVSTGIYYYLFKANGRTWKGWVEVVK
jgi:gliding motility-associated-like protein